MSARGAAGSPTTPVASGATSAAPSQAPPVAASPPQDAQPIDRDSDGQLTAQRDAPVGGQAVLEGVMMRGVSNWAVAVRKPTAEQAEGDERAPGDAVAEGDERVPGGDAFGGEIEVQAYPLRSALKRHRALRLPIVRGVV